MKEKQNEPKQENQENIFKLAMFEQQIRQMQEQLQAIEQGMNELNILNLGLDELKGKEEKEIFAPIGRGIFVKSKILSEELIVDVGNKKLVKKTIPETQKLISEQTKKLEEVKKEMIENMETISKEAEELINSQKK